MTALCILLILTMCSNRSVLSRGRGGDQTFMVIKRRLGNLTFLKSDSNIVVGGAEHEQRFIVVLYFILWISVTAQIKLPSNHTKVRPENPEWYHKKHCRFHLRAPSLLQGAMMKKTIPLEETSCLHSRVTLRLVTVEGFF